MTVLKRILFIGDLNSYGRSYQRYLALIAMEYKVTGLSFAVQNEGSGITNENNLWIRFRQKLGYPIDTTGINQKIINMVKRERFNLLWIEKGLMIYPNTLNIVKKINPKLILVFNSEDNMFLRHNQSIYFRKCLPLYDIVFTTKSRNINELPSIGAKKVYFVDQSYSSIIHNPIFINKSEFKKYKTAVGFIGSFERERAEYMLFLAKNSILVRVWGNGWNRWRNFHPNLKIEYKAIYSKNYVKSICCTKINLCFLRKINFDLQTSRTMEIPACGGFMLAERTNEHLRLFREDKEAAFFESKQELLKKVQYYLKHEDERKLIAKAGRIRCVKSGYSHKDRLELMLKKIGEL